MTRRRRKRRSAVRCRIVSTRRASKGFNLVVIRWLAFCVQLTFCKIGLSRLRNRGIEGEGMERKKRKRTISNETNLSFLSSREERLVGARSAFHRIRSRRNLCAITAPSNVSLFFFPLSTVIEKCLYFSLRRLSRDL